MQGLEQAETGKDPPGHSIGPATAAAADQNSVDGEDSQLQQQEQAGSQNPVLLQQSRGDPRELLQTTGSRVFGEPSLAMGGWLAPQWQASDAALGSSTALLQERHLVSAEEIREAQRKIVSSGAHCSSELAVSQGRLH